MAAVQEDLAVDVAAAMQRGEDIREEKALWDRVLVAFDKDNKDWDRLTEMLKSRGLLKVWKARIEKAARERYRIKSIGRSNEPAILIREVWKDAPVGESVVCPPEFGVVELGNEDDEDVGAIYKTVTRDVDGESVQKKVSVCFDPLVITKRIQGENGSLMIEIAWRTGPRWHSAVLPRETILDSRSLIRAASKGAPISSVNAASVVAYLQAYEHYNIANIARGYATTSMGWKGTDEDPTHDGFMCGSHQIGGNGRPYEVSPIADGDTEDIDVVGRSGSFEDWTAAMKELEDWPVIKLFVYASLASPLLLPLGAPNMIVELAGPTTGGKTTAMGIAQSCWRPGGFKIQSWNNTVNGFEAKAHANTDMPLFIDDTKTAMEQGKAAVVAKVIYQFISGRGRGRAARDGGQRATATWRSIMLSTGEMPANEIAKAEGAATRVLSLWSNPLGKQSPATAKRVDKIQRIIDRSYGHAGPKLVQWLCENKQEWPALLERFDKVAEAVREQHSSSAASRLAKVIAILEVTAYVAERAGAVPWIFKPLFSDPTIKRVLNESIANASAAANQARAAWDDVCSYANARREQWLEWGEPDTDEGKSWNDFPDRGPDGEQVAYEPSSEEGNKPRQPSFRRRAPLSGWLGWIKTGVDLVTSTEVAQRYAWEPPQLQRALRDLGYAEMIGSILRTWREKRIIETDDGDRFTIKESCGRNGARHRVILMTANDFMWDERYHEDPDEVEKLQ